LPILEQIRNIMTALAHKLAGTRQLLDPILGESRSLARAPLGHAGADRVLRGGLAKAALHEVFPADTSAAASGFVLGLAERVRGHKRLLWIRQDFAALEHAEISATGLAELGIDPSKLLLLRAANAEDALRAGADALSCAALGALIVEIPGHPKVLDLVASRRLALGAQSKGVTVFLLRPSAEPAPGAAETRWRVRSLPSDDEDWGPSAGADNWGSPRFEIELTRNRHGELGRWAMEWCCDERSFKAAANSRPLAAAPAGRALETAEPAWRRAG
jgi:protein ImuA